MSSKERPPLKHPLGIASVLKELLGDREVGDQLTRHQAWLVWDKLVGPQIAARARPLRLRKGVLEVQVDHPVWMQQLQMMKTLLLEKISTALPEAGITDIYLRKSSKPLSPPPTPQKPELSRPWQQIDISREELSRLDRQVAHIDNIEVRRELRRLLLQQMKLDKSRSR